MNIGKDHRRVNASFRENFAPRRHGETVAVGVAAMLMTPALSRGEHEALAFDGASLDERMPMRFTGGLRESRGRGDELGAVLGKRAVKVGETQVVADREAEVAQGSSAITAWRPGS